MNTTLFEAIKPTVISAVIAMNISLNVLVIAVIVRHPQLREDRTTLFMLSLTLCDLANGCTAMPISAAVCSNATPNARAMIRYLPKVHIMCTAWFTFSSMHSLCWVTVCKLVAITQPLRFEQILSRRRCYVIIASIWFSGAALAASFLHGDTTWQMNTCTVKTNRHLVAMTAIFLITLILGLAAPVVVIVYATARIFCVIVRTHRNITSQVGSIGGEVVQALNMPALTLKSIRSGKNVLIICLAYLILTIPMAVDVFAIVIQKDMYLPSWYGFAAVWILMCNSSVNCILYLVLFRSVRRNATAMISTWVNCIRQCL